MIVPAGVAPHQVQFPLAAPLLHVRPPLSLTPHFMSFSPAVQSRPKHYVPIAPYWHRPKTWITGLNPDQVDLQCVSIQSLTRL